MYRRIGLPNVSKPVRIFWVGFYYNLVHHDCNKWIKPQIFLMKDSYIFFLKNVIVKVVTFSEDYFLMYIAVMCACNRMKGWKCLTCLECCKTQTKLVSGFYKASYFVCMIWRCAMNIQHCTYKLPCNYNSCLSSSKNNLYSSLLFTL